MIPRGAGYHQPMMIRQSIASLALFATVAAVAGLGAGCAQTSTSDTSGSGASGAPSVAPTGTGSTAQDALLGSVQRLSQTTYRYRSVSGELVANGAADPVAKKSSSKLTGTNKGNLLTIEMASIDTDLWLRLNLGADNSRLGIATDKWLHVDTARLGANSTLPVDPSGGAAIAGGLLAGVVDVQSPDNRHFAGTVDISKAGAVAAQLLDQAGATPRPVPSAGLAFTAEADDQGRLTNLTVDLSSVATGLRLALSFSDFGAPVTVARPDPAEVAEAPASVYNLFGH